MKPTEGPPVALPVPLEVDALAKVPAFASMIIDHGTHYAVNEHLQHAISDFASRVYDAFDQLEEQADMIATAQVSSE